MLDFDKLTSVLTHLFNLALPPRSSDISILQPSPIPYHGLGKISKNIFHLFICRAPGSDACQIFCWCICEERPQEETWDSNLSCFFAAEIHPSCPYSP